MHSILIIVLFWKISTLSTHHVPREGFVVTLILLPLPHPPNFPPPTPHTPSIIPLYCFNFHCIVPENINTPSKRVHWLEPPTPNSTHIQFLQWLQTSFKKFGFTTSPLPTIPHLHLTRNFQRPLKAWEWIFSELYITTFNIFYQPLPSLLINVSSQEVLLMWRVLWT